MRRLVAVAHGTLSAAGVAELRALVALAARARPGLAAELAFVGDTSPSVGRVLAGLGSAPAAVVPLLLVAAAHSKTDIAASVQLARARGADLRYGRPLGQHPLMLEAVAGRLAQAGVAAGAPVVLVAAGSADPAANAELVATGRLLAEQRGAAAGGGQPGRPGVVEVAFASATGPDLPEVLGRLERLGSPPSTVAVVPYVLAPGHFADRIAGQARAAGAAVTGVLGAHPAVAQLLAERYDEACDGDIRMACDVCKYRAPVGGRSADVGALQRPHAHPDDPRGDPEAS